MRTKRNAAAATRADPAAPEGGELRQRIRPDLERLGLGAALVETLARRLEPVLASLPGDQYGAVLESVVATCTAHRVDGDGRGIAASDVADVERLMEGVREEVQKLDEGLRVLAAYVTGLRRRAQRGPHETLH